MTSIKTYLLDPIHKVFFGVFSIFVILLISPIMAFMIAYLFLGDTNYLEYLNPDLNWDEITERDDQHN